MKASKKACRHPPKRYADRLPTTIILLFFPQPLCIVSCKMPYHTAKSHVCHHSADTPHICDP